MKVFIDCGANTGTSVELFKSKFPDWEEYKIYCFEANPDLKKCFDNYPNVVFINKAVWIHDGVGEFYMSSKYGSYANSMIKNKKTGNLTKKVMIPCVDFSKWIQKFSKHDHLVVKFDIEGAEYPVLTKMIQENALQYIKDFYVDWHYKKIGVSKETHDFIVKEFLNLNITPKSWSTESGRIGVKNLG